MRTRSVFCALLFAVAAVLCSCHYEAQHERQYSVNFNFMVTGDSLPLQVEQPMHNDLSNMLLDTVYVGRDDQLVVAQIAVIPEDSVDSVWVKVARDQMTMGWVHESQLMRNVVPDDPISKFIYLFSRVHVWWFVGLIGVVVVILLTRRVRHEHLCMVHVADIASCYPTLLCLTLSGSALVYASIQRHAPETWVYFYYHPTLNPFGLPLILGVFLTGVWMMLVLLIATVDEVRRQLSAGEAFFYLLLLSAVMMVEYLFFSLAAMVNVGYPLLVVYGVWALWRYWRRFRPRYMCGRCGRKLHDVGRCPKCGALNG